MLNQKIFGLSLTTWIVIAVIIYYFFFCTQCNMENFVAEEVDSDDEETSSNNNLKIYNFNTAWCGHSRRFQPTWDEFMKKHNGKNGVTIRDVKCDDEEDDVGQGLCEKYDVPGYPTIIFTKGGEKIDYMGPRSIEGLEEQMKQLL